MLFISYIVRPSKLVGLTLLEKSLIKKLTFVDACSGSMIRMKSFKEKK